MVPPKIKTHVEARYQIAVADTPFQIISIICYLVMHAEDGCVTDLLVLEHHQGIAQHLTGLEKTKLFRRVEVLSDTYTVKFHLSYQMISNCIVHRDQALNRLMSCGCTLTERRYERLISGCPNLLVHDVAIALLKPGFDTVFVDDGTGSHTGIIYTRIACLDSLVNPMCSDYSLGVRVRETAKRIINVFTLGRMKLNVRGLYLFAPAEREIARYRSKLHIEALAFGVRTSEAVATAFSLGEENPYKGVRVVYIAQPPDVPEALCLAEAQVLSIVAGAVPDLVVRPHPRGISAAVASCGCAIDNSGDSWEALLAAQKIPSDAVLVGFASTAQATPKLLFGLEPTLILLHELIDGSDLLKKAGQQTAKDLFVRYQAKGKILIPKTIGELDSMFAAISSLR